MNAAIRPPRQDAAERTAPLAFVRYDAAHDGDETLQRCARGLQEAGFRVAGVVQSDRPRPNRRKCDMFLRNLATGEEICISADRGDEARGCRLDYAALAEAVCWAEQALASEPHILILNKFGKEEALGRGFFPVMAEALSRNIPVLAGVSNLNFAAAQILTGGIGAVVEPTEDAIVRWRREVLGERGDATGSAIA